MTTTTTKQQATQEFINLYYAACQEQVGPKQAEEFPKLLAEFLAARGFPAN